MGVTEIIIDVLIISLILTMLFPFIIFVYDSFVWFFSDSPRPYGEIVATMTNAYENTYFVTVQKSFEYFLGLNDNEELPSPVPDYANLGKGYKNLLDQRFWEYWLGRFSSGFHERLDGLIGGPSQW